jgi:hypothetical protein
MAHDATTTAAPAFLKDAIARTNSEQAAAPPDITQLRAKATELRDVNREIEDTEQRLKELGERKIAIETGELVDMMDQLRMRSFELEAEGNHPALQFKAGAFYRANIAASWPEDQRRAAFEYLDGEGAGDLVKVVVTATFSRGERDKADRAMQLLIGAGFTPSISLSVPWTTLTAWLKEQVERLSRMPKLDLIGGQVGRIVKVSPIAESDNTRPRRHSTKKDD